MSFPSMEHVETAPEIRHCRILNKIYSQTHHYLLTQYVVLMKFPQVYDFLIKLIGQAFAQILEATAMRNGFCVLTDVRYKFS